MLPVEFLNFDSNDTQTVNFAFDRLNRNMRKLESQELRHARWDGWFIQLVESECEKLEWKTIGIATAARSKRMKDAQFISELLLCLFEKKQHGFDQDNLDRAYGRYDDLEECAVEVNTDDFLHDLEVAKSYLISMQEHNECVRKHASSLAHMYTLWAAVALHMEELGCATDFADIFKRFMEEGKVIMADQSRLSAALASNDPLTRTLVVYQQAAKGAATDLNPREKRLEALMTYVRSLPS